MQERLLGGSHPDVAITLNSLGKLLGNRGEKQASEAVLKAVLSIQRKCWRATIRPPLRHWAVSLENFRKRANGLKRNRCGAKLWRYGQAWRE